MAANEINDSFKPGDEIDRQQRTFEPDLGQPLGRITGRDRPVEDLINMLDGNGDQIRQAQEWVSSIASKLASLPQEYLAGWAEHNAKEAARGEPAYVELLKAQKGH